MGPSSQRANECRIAMFLAGFPTSVPVHTVNRQCSSGAWNNGQAGWWVGGWGSVGSVPETLLAGKAQHCPANCAKVSLHQVVEPSPALALPLAAPQACRRLPRWRLPSGRATTPLASPAG